MVKIPVDEEITGRVKQRGQGGREGERERERERGEGGEGREIGRFEIVTHGLSGMSL